MLGRTNGEHNYYVTQALRNTLAGGEQDFMSIGSKDDLWTYIVSDLMPAILEDEWTNNGNAGPLESGKNMVGGTNILIGGWRLNQKRVAAAEDCEVAPHLAHFVKICYPQYSSWKTEKKAMNMATFTVPYSTSTESGDSYWQGVYGYYDGGGYFVDLPANAATSSSKVSELIAANFIDQQTRALIIDINTYNPAFNVDGVVRLAVEFPADGGAYPIMEVKSWNFARNVGSRGVMLRPLEFCFYVFVLWYTFEELMELFFVITKMEPKWKCFKGFKSYKNLNEYLADNYNYVDLVNLGFYYAGMVLWALVWVYTDAVKNADVANSFVSMRVPQRLFQMNSWFNMTNGFLLFVKLFKYLTFSAKLRFLFTTLQHAGSNIANFVVVLFIFLCGFALAGYICFGSDVAEFSTWSTAIKALIRCLVTDLPFDALVLSNAIFGNIFYILWNIVTIMVFINVFVAIICNAFDEVTALMEEEDVKVEIPNPFSFLVKGNYADGDGKISLDELRAALQCTQEEAEDIMAKYSEDGETLTGEQFQIVSTLPLASKNQDKSIEALKNAALSIHHLVEALEADGGRLGRKSISALNGIP